VTLVAPLLEDGDQFLKRQVATFVRISLLEELLTATRRHHDCLPV